MRKRKAIIAWLLVTVMLLGLAACNRTPKGKGEDSEENQGAPQYYARTLTYDLGELHDICVDGDGYYLASEKGVWRLDSTFALEEEPVRKKDTELVTVKDGALVALSQTPPNYEWKIRVGEEKAFPMGLFYADNGQLFAWGGNVWCCNGWDISRNGVQLELPGTDWKAKALICRQDGLYAVLVEYREGIQVSAWLIPLDSEETMLSKSDGISLPEELFNATPFCSPDSGCVLQTGELWRQAGDTLEQTADLTEFGVNPTDLKRVLITKSGEILCLEAYCLTVLSADGTTAAPQKKILRIGAGWTEDYPYLYALATYFNRTNSEYRLVVKFYNEQDKLNRALLNGELDLISLGVLEEIRNYGKRGLLQPLEDLEPELLTSDLLYQNTLDAMKMGGHTYAVPLVLHPHIATLPDRFGVDPVSVDTFAALTELLEQKAPLLFECETKSLTFGYDWLPMTFYRWVDPEAGTARFDSPEFISFLEYCNRFMQTMEEVEASEGMQHMQELPKIVTYYGIYRVVDASLVTGNSVYTLPVPGQSAVVMESGCNIAALRGGDSEGVKCLLETIMTDEGWHQTLVRKNEENSRVGDGDFVYLNRDWTKADFEYYGGMILSNPFREFPDSRREKYPVVWEEMQQRIEDSHQMFLPIYPTTELYTVITEEAEVYFNGDISAEEAARRIQNRVEIYLAERE